MIESCKLRRFGEKSGRLEIAVKHLWIGCRSIEAMGANLHRTNFQAGQPSSSGRVRDRPKTIAARRDRLGKSPWPCSSSSAARGHLATGFGTTSPMLAKGNTLPDTA